MDLGLSEQQEMLRKMARDFLATECPKSLVRQMEDDEKGYTPQLWQNMAEMGWMGLPFPEEYGGSGGTFLDLAVLLEEMGRACLPGPFFSTVVSSGLTILDAGSTEQKQEYLPQLANGKLIMTLALLEPGGTYQAKDVATEAVRHTTQYAVKGTKLFVPDAHVANWIICVARTGKRNDPEEGITLFLVDRSSQGITCELLPSLAKDRQCEVVFDGVMVPAGNALGQTDLGWSVVLRLLQRAAVAKSVEIVGAAQQVLEMTVSYAKERIQFDRPIGSFQAVQHHCANMAIAVDSARYMAYQAAWALSEGLPCDMEAAAAKAWASDAYRQVAALGHQVHGAIGFTLDHDMQLYSRRAKAAEVAFGDADFHREIVARMLER